MGVAPDSLPASPMRQCLAVEYPASSVPLTPPPPQTGDALAAALACPGVAGHFDELRGVAWHGSARTPPLPLADPWHRFFQDLEGASIADLSRRADVLARQIRDNGITYNVYTDPDGPQRPWALDLFPLVLTPQSWRQIEAGVRQRAELLERVMADVYGAQTLLRAGLLPPALVHGHPGYLRPMQGVPAVGGTYLHIVAFDLARGPDGQWWVVSQRTQAPSGLGYLLENRLSISRLFPRAFESLRVQHLASTYKVLVEGLKRMSPGGADGHIALLTPGPYNETYFEHAWLARYLGLTLVQGEDLTVRDDRLYLRTLRGLEPVHGLLKRLDDEFLDPLELRPDSMLGVPGLLQAIRAGHVLVANAPGAAFLESTALLGFLPAIARRLLGRDLTLPSLPTWWCGEQAAMAAVLPRLVDCVIKPVHVGSHRHEGFDSVLGRTLTPAGLDEWARRIQRAGEHHAVQAHLPLSQMPSWQDPVIQPRSVMLRVFAMADGPGSWRVLPGGLTRLGAAGTGVASMQRGGTSADTWVMVDAQAGEQVDRTSLLRPPLATAASAPRKRVVTSRAAENLFWLGRYSERADNGIRLARLTLDALHSEAPSPPLLAWLDALARQNTLVLPAVPSAAQARRVFARSLIASLASTDQATSVGYQLRALKLCASSVRERLSPEHWSVITRAEAELTDAHTRAVARGGWTVVEALRALDTASGHMAAITGAQTDRMIRDDGWRLLSIGRHIERLSFLCPALARGLATHAISQDDGFEALLVLFDSAISFHAQYQQTREVPALIELLVLDRDNPRSVAWVMQTLRGRLSRLGGAAPDEMDALARQLPDPATWQSQSLCAVDATGAHPGLQALLDACRAAAWKLSDAIGHRYFTHADSAGHSMGA